MVSEPWYKTTLRWAQTNLVEIDPERYDANFWREHWRKTRIQGVIINAGGIVTYYPSEIPLHKPALKLAGRDLYGEIVKAARDEKLTVIARMDSNRVSAEFYRAHPDWIAVDAAGNPYREADKYVTCINSAYYAEYLPSVIREIISRSKPDGFADNNWAGLRRGLICHCRNCQEQFEAFSGLLLPHEDNWSSEPYRKWIQWSYRRRTEIWELNNRVTTEAGGPDCAWMGMISGDVLHNNERFIDLPEILSRSPIIMLDHQRRNGVDGFEQNTEAGKRLHEVGGWNVLIPESTPQYQLGSPAFRLSSMPPAEVRLWSSSGFAGGIQPWWHHIGSMHEDRRQYRTAEPIFKWHEANQDVLFNRSPVADVAVLWSQKNHDYLGQHNASEATLNPYRGATKALDKAGIAWLPLHADAVGTAAGRFKVLILPNLGAMSAAQIAAVQAFADEGGSVIATSESSLYSEHGDRLADFALGALFGLHRRSGEFGGQGKPDGNIETHARHSYLRLSPELRAGVYGPSDPTAPTAAGTRHPLLAGLDDTDTLPFGGYLPVAEADEDTTVLATFIPDFPIYPPETSFMRTFRTNLPAITVKKGAGGGNLIWFVADLDRCFAREEQFEHALLLANAVRWSIGEGQEAVRVEGGHGLVTPTLYRQGNRQVLHLNNRLVTSRVPGRQDELVPVGPTTVRVRAADGGKAPATVDLRVAGRQVDATMDGSELVFSVDRILDHEVAVIDWA
ncbi:Beta-galactosidase GanA [Kaistia soli DSM 19436]|uniref:Beta-galactosidase GanA n=1 Tax=Kaistia soli DSM 19436 TaxID=1122133 RepID=A0A1M5GCY5_9HYPH|nr:beta-galactosidase [Kaistia soli]SHG01538.1 Beta-galactosidase GanA [Kaistia soli DSM 19436]